MTGAKQIERVAKSLFREVGPFLWPRRDQGHAATEKEAMTSWHPIETAPRDGTIIRLKCAAHPEYGEHAMYWDSPAQRWEGMAFAPARAVKTWWDEAAEQPTHWKHLDKP